MEAFPFNSYYLSQLARFFYFVFTTEFINHIIKNEYIIFFLDNTSIKNLKGF